MAATTPTSIDQRRCPSLRALAYRAGDAAIIAVEGRLDSSGAPVLERALTDALERGHRTVVLDMHGLRDLDPDATSVLWAGLRSTLRRGGTLATAGLRPTLTHALEPLLPHGLKSHRTVRAAIVDSDMQHP